MDFASQLISELGDHNFSEKAKTRLNTLAQISPLYRKIILHNSHYWAWLEKLENLNETFRWSAFSKIWEDEFLNNKHSLQQQLKALKAFRRKICMRIAYREINKMASTQESVKELSFLAEFCVGTILSTLYKKLSEKLGCPYCEEQKSKTRFCVIALGKLGSAELNFCSDIDLLYFYEGRGQCVRNNQTTETSNQEFFTTLFQQLTKMLSDRSADGFLYNVDLRLRPEGDKGPLVQTCRGLENYYSTRGQTWERMMLMRARPIAGDLSLGEETLEDLNSFRYPRSPQLSMLEQIGALKARRFDPSINDDGDDLENNIKHCPGGIRDIEFLLFGNLLIHAGKNPFIQTFNTAKAIEQLTLYNFLNEEDSELIAEAYWFYRGIENILQMEEETQIHSLPSNPNKQEILAKQLSFKSWKDLYLKIQNYRKRVIALFDKFFPKSEKEELVQEWVHFLSGSEPVESVLKEIKLLFTEESAQCREALKQFILGKNDRSITHEHIKLFLELKKTLHEIGPGIATPLETLKRISSFADGYGARIHFFKTCLLNTNLLKAVALLFDHSVFTHKILCQQPELFEEVLYISPKRKKSVQEHVLEIQQLPKENFEKYLWMYVKAEQTRLSLAELVHKVPFDKVQASLTTLADAVILSTLQKFELDKQITVLGLGKYGGQELSPGADLDIILFTGQKKQEGLEKNIQEWLKCIQHSAFLGKTYQIDLRLRPYGNDGPITTSWETLEQYHNNHGKLWEKQSLLRGRIIGESSHDIKAFSQFQNNLIYGTAINSKDLEEIKESFQKIKNEKIDPAHPTLSVKYTDGGILQTEFLAQSLQLVHGAKEPKLRNSNTLQTLKLIDEQKFMPSEIYENYYFLRKIEFYMRRYYGDAVTDLDKPLESNIRAAKWLGFTHVQEFIQKYQTTLKNQEILLSACSQTALNTVDPMT